MNKEKIADNLLEILDTYVDMLMNDVVALDVEEEYIIDEILDLKEAIFKDGVEEGQFCQTHRLVTTMPINLYDVVEVNRALDGETIKLKVMGIISIKLKKDKSAFIVEFLGKKSV